MTARRIALLDTNVLLLKMVAETDPSLLRTFKRVQTFEERDIALLDRLLSEFDTLLSTPHVLAEASNFIDQAPAHRRTELIETFQRYVSESTEHYESALDLMARAEFVSLGLADTGLSSLSRIAVVITTDFHLSGRIEKAGGAVINFNQARSYQLLDQFKQPQS